MSVRIEIDASDPNAEMRRLAGPDLHDLLRFEAIMTTKFAASQRVVHVITGSLKGSGEQDSSYHDHVWTGEITYGGRSYGPINPVDYAFYEYRRGSAAHGTAYPQGTLTHPRQGHRITNGRHAAFVDELLRGDGVEFEEAMLAFLRGDRS